MKRPNITPGPWIKSEEDRHGLWIENDADEPEEICMVSAATVSHPEFQANAQAIAAIPETHEALELARALIQECRWRFPKSIKHPDTFQMSLADAAINKALTKAGYDLTA